MITHIGEWLLQTACADAVAWPKDIKVAVNLSAVQFRKNNLVDVVMCALAQSGLPPERLELEITETALMNQRRNVCRFCISSRISELQSRSMISAPVIRH